MILYLFLRSNPKLLFKIPQNQKKMIRRLIDISETGKEFSNAPKNIKFTPKRYFFPEHKEDIAIIVQEAERESCTVRAVGSGHSFSSIQKCLDFFLDMGKIDFVERIEDSRNNLPADQSNLIHVGAGITLKKLNQILDKMGLALPNMGTINVQTISGALSTGTHGTGLNRPSFPDIVRSIGLVMSEGRHVRIEPKNGITDPNRPRDRNEELIQDDDLFYSTLVCFGSFGIIYDLIIEVVPAFWITETREEYTWEEIRRDLIKNTLIEQTLEEFDYVSYRINPYQVGGYHLAIQVNQKILKEKPEDKGLNESFKSLGSLIAGAIPHIPPAGLTTYLNTFPKKTPKILNSILRGTRDKIFTGKSYKALFQSAINLKPYGISTEFAFPLESQTLMDQVENVIKLTKELKEDDIYLSSFISIRFAPASKAFLSSSYGKPSFYIEVPFLKGVKGTNEVMDKFQKLFLDQGGIPHWGKANNCLYENPSVIRDLYPKLDTWLEAKRRLDPNGTFTNKFMKTNQLIPPTA